VEQGMKDKKIEKLLDAFETLIDVKLIMAFYKTPVYTNTITDNNLDVWKPTYYKNREELREALIRVLEDGHIRR
jgi:hypothetical protein